MAAGLQGGRLKPCIEWVVETRHPCGELSHETRCPAHRRAYEHRRAEREPWRFFYEDPRWSRARLKVLARDGHQCTFASKTTRCLTTVPLQVHHEVKLRHLWKRYGSPQRGSEGWTKFVLAGCDMRKLRTLCEAHHKRVDNTDPATKWIGIPGPRASVQVRRNFRSKKRRGLPRDERPRKKRIEHDADDD